MLGAGKWSAGELLLVAVFAAAAMGQTKPTKPPAPAPARGGFDPAAMRERIMSTIKDSLNCTDDEWKVIEPKVVKVILLKMDAGELGIPNRRGRNGFSVSSFVRNILDPNALPSPVDEKLGELQTMIEQNETSTDAYRNKLIEVRNARKKARDELAAAEKDVTGLLTVRQEAELVQLGILE